MRGRPPIRPESRFPNRIRELRRALKLPQEKLGEMIGVSHTDIGRWERGDRPLKADAMRRVAEALNVSVAELIDGERAASVPVVGRVGAGAEIHPIDDHPKGEGLYEVECPRGLDPKATVAVEVVGDSMAPAIMEGWVLFYDRAPEPTPSSVVGKLCVVKLEDGRVLVKQLKRGPEKGRFNLLSLNGPMIEDVALEWAAPVKAMLPREIVGGG